MCIRDRTMGDRIVVMKDGIIQQVDTPQNLYDMPCNMFVAGFIGSPQMNFLDGTLIKKGDLYGIDLGGDVIPLPKEKTAEDVYKRQRSSLPRNTATPMPCAGWRISAISGWCGSFPARCGKAGLPPCARRALAATPGWACLPPVPPFDRILWGFPA